MGNILVDQNKHLFSRNKNKSILFLPLFGKRLLYAVTILIIYRIISVSCGVKHFMPYMQCFSQLQKMIHRLYLQKVTFSRSSYYINHFQSIMSHLYTRYAQVS